MSFRTKILLHGTSATGIEIPPDGLSYSDRRRIVLAIEGAKAAETRARRIARTVDDLGAGAA
jgi:uncharacterized protein YdeI (YjbR/CyaY-like superfamily)